MFVEILVPNAGPLLNYITNATLLFGIAVMILLPCWTALVRYTKVYWRIAIPNFLLSSIPSAFFLDSVAKVSLALVIWWVLLFCALLLPKATDIE